MNKTMNAEEYLNQLRELDEGLWEQVLDTITDHHNKTIPDNDDGMKYYITLYDEGKVVLELYPYHNTKTQPIPHRLASSRGA